MYVCTYIYVKNMYVCTHYTNKYFDVVFFRNIYPLQYDPHIKMIDIQTNKYAVSFNRC